MRIELALSNDTLREASYRQESSLAWTAGPLWVPLKGKRSGRTALIRFNGPLHVKLPSGVLRSCIRPYVPLCCCSIS